MALQTHRGKCCFFPLCLIFRHLLTVNRIVQGFPSIIHSHTASCHPWTASVLQYPIPWSFSGILSKLTWSDVVFTSVCLEQTRLDLKHSNVLLFFFHFGQNVSNIASARVCQRLEITDAYVECLSLRQGFWHLNTPKIGLFTESQLFGSQQKGRRKCCKMINKYSTKTTFCHWDMQDYHLLAQLSHNVRFSMQIDPEERFLPLFKHSKLLDISLWGNTLVFNVLNNIRKEPLFSFYLALVIHSDGPITWRGI